MSIRSGKVTTTAIKDPTKEAKNINTTKRMVRKILDDGRNEETFCFRIKT
ncbi:MAG: hypothetical protein JRI87_12715 [Deltaproteobacteria bacterium]|nr:hypothetical protein [Deltaproteobacteria bacterium]